MVTTITEPSVDAMTIGAPHGLIIGASTRNTNWFVVVVDPRVSVVDTSASKKAGIAVLSVDGQFPFASGES